MNPHLQASLDAYEELLDSLETFVAPLGDDLLNWAPPAAEANSIAALVHHICGSTASWLARAVGETIQRDRESEFRGHGNAAELVEMLRRCRSELRRRVALLDGRDLGDTIVTRRTTGELAGQEQRLSLAWCLEHALVHAGEHWGHIQLTAQLHART
jgi:hypothetical protein